MRIGPDSEDHAAALGEGDGSGLDPGGQGRRDPSRWVTCDLVVRVGGGLSKGENG